jgi:hypothetical protein
LTGVEIPRTIEHGSSRAGRWLRERRLRFALWIAVLEGVLLLVHVIPRWPAILLAAVVILSYLTVGRKTRNDIGYELILVAAASQAMVILIPVLLFIVGTIALVAVAILAAVALFVLFTDRAARP